MVKASAYGAGSYEIAKSLQEHHVDYLAVAVARRRFRTPQGRHYRLYYHYGPGTYRIQNHV